MCSEVLMESIPLELWVFIFSFLDQSEIGFLSRVCQEFRYVCYSDVIWRPFLQNRLNGGESMFRPTQKAIVSTKVPQYVILGKRMTCRMQYARILYWFYKKELGRGYNYYKIYPLTLILKRTRMIEKLENSGCVPKHWMKSKRITHS